MIFRSPFSCGKKNVSVRRLSRRTDTDNKHNCAMPIAPREIPELTEKRQRNFWKKVNKNGPIVPHVGTPCWDWTASRNNQGYGTFGVGSGTHRQSHRVSWQIENGPIPYGSCILHKCDRTCCVNPLHLFPGSHKDNADDRDSKGRGNPATGDNAALRKHPHLVLRGERHSNSKLVESDVIEIRMRRSTGETPKAIAGDFGISTTLVRNIHLRKTWKHV